MSEEPLMKIRKFGKTWIVDTSDVAKLGNVPADVTVVPCSSSLMDEHPEWVASRAQQLGARRDDGTA